MDDLYKLTGKEEQTKEEPRPEDNVGDSLDGVINAEVKRETDLSKPRAALFILVIYLLIKLVLVVKEYLI